MGGRLVLASTPIGDLEDASPRLRAALRDADVIAAEDTRRLRSLMQGLDETTAARIVSYYDAVERERIPALIDDLADGKTIVLVTDAGTPSVSDPGYRLVTAAIDGGYDVTAIPGPSAVLVALAISGLPVDRFCFEGFLPRKAGERRTRLEELEHESRTMVFFEAPHRALETLQAMSEVFGADRPAALCRELTKTYEEVLRGSLVEVIDKATEGIRGEVTLVVQGAPAQAPAQWQDQVLAAMVRDRMEAGETSKEAIAAVAQNLSLPRKQVFEAFVQSKAAARNMPSLD